MSNTIFEKLTKTVENLTYTKNHAYYETTNQNTISDIKYQDITYHMDNPGKTVKSKEEKQIDFLKAANEMKDLDWNYEWNYITFVNRETDECLQFKRLEQNRWYADVPINDGENWDGYYWAAYGDSKTIMDMLRLFFDQTPWFGMLAWKMRRFKH